MRQPNIRGRAKADLYRDKLICKQLLMYVSPEQLDSHMEAIRERAALEGGDIFEATKGHINVLIEQI